MLCDMTNILSKKKYNRTPCMSCYVYTVNFEHFPLAGYMVILGLTRTQNALATVANITQDPLATFLFV